MDDTSQQHSETAGRSGQTVSSGEHEVVVIGAGIVGVCCALALQDEGRQVTIVDRNEPGMACSYGNAGQIAAEHVYPLASTKTFLQVPAMLMRPNGPLVVRWPYLPKLAPWLVRFLAAGLPSRFKAATAALAEINGQSVQAYDDLLGALGLSEFVRHDGMLTAFRTEKPFHARCRETNDLNALGVRTEIIEGRDIAAFDPALSPELAGGIYFPDSAKVLDPYRLVVELAEKFTERGGTLLKGDVGNLSATAQGYLLGLEDTDLNAARVVLCGGAWSAKLTRSLGYKIPLIQNAAIALWPMTPACSREYR